MKTTIFNIVYFINIYAKLFGMAPFHVERTKEKIVCRTSRFSLVQAFIVAAVTATMITCRHFYVQLVVPTNATEILLRLFAHAKIFSAIAAMLMLWYHQNDLVQSFYAVHHFDIYMRKIDVLPPQYFVLSYAQAFFVFLVTAFFPSALGWYGYYYQGYSYDVVIYDVLSNGLQCAVHLFVMVYVTFFILIIYIRFYFLHSTLEKFEDSKKSRLKGDPITVLNYICIMYNTICKGSLRFNKVFSFSIFFIVIFNMLEALLIVYLIMVVRVREERTMLYLAYNMSMIVLVLLPTGITHRKTKGLAKYLTESTFCYENETACIVRSSFMLQTLQEGILFDACGCFVISMAAFIDQLSVCVSFLLFLYQLVNMPPRSERYQ